MPEQNEQPRQVPTEAYTWVHDLALSELMRAEGLVDTEAFLVPKQGGQRPVAITASTLRNEKGEPQGVVIVAKDVGEVQKLQRERVGILERAKQEAEGAVAQRTKELENLVARLKASEQQQKAANQQLNAANQQLASAQHNLQEKLLELERFNKVAVGRELKMVELKQEIDRLKGSTQAGTNPSV